MRLNYKRLRIGSRTFKTALAVILSLMVVSIYGTTASKMIFAMAGAMNAMERTFQKSLESCLTQIVGMICGVIAGVLLSGLPIHPVICIGIGIVIIITLYNVFRFEFSPVLPCMMIVSVCTTPDMQPFVYALGRLWDTAIGLGIGMIINLVILPYDNSLKIRNSIEYLEEEVIAFLEDMFDGNDQIPDTVKMTQTIDEMASEMGIYSNQWLPFHMAQSHERLELFRVCEGKARQLLAHMEVLSRMQKAGILSDDNKTLLQMAGANIRDKRIAVHMQEEDIITNYHIRQILVLRQELIDTLSSI